MSGTEFAILAIGGIFILGFAGDYFYQRQQSRPCPRCGRRIVVGKTGCECGYDYDGRNP